MRENIRQDVNGSTDKPFPQERNFVLNADPDMGVESGTFVPSRDKGQDVALGQVKYARREGATSIYKDVTRNTVNDNAASRKAEASTLYETEPEEAL